MEEFTQLVFPNVRNMPSLPLGWMEKQNVGRNDLSKLQSKEDRRVVKTRQSNRESSFKKDNSRDKKRGEIDRT